MFSCRFNRNSCLRSKLAMLRVLKICSPGDGQGSSRGSVASTQTISRNTLGEKTETLRSCIHTDIQQEHIGREDSSIGWMNNLGAYITLLRTFFASCWLLPVLYFLFRPVSLPAYEFSLPVFSSLLFVPLHILHFTIQNIKQREFQVSLIPKLKANNFISGVQRDCPRSPMP